MDLWFLRFEPPPWLLQVVAMLKLYTLMLAPYFPFLTSNTSIPAFDNKTNAVSWDHHSFTLSDQRVFIFSGEVHPWRIPTGAPAWNDVFQKMSAAGFNTISVYHHWYLSETAQGTLNFGGYRNHSEVYEIAKDLGMLVMSRPGPYINAETLGGGFPGWLSNTPAMIRSTDKEYTDAWVPYIKAASEFIIPYQYPDGPIISVQAENEFSPSFNGQPTRSDYMQLLLETFRLSGIQNVPLTHNDAHQGGVFRPGSGLGSVDLYMWDEYPNDFNCAQPDVWSEVDHNLDADHQAYDPQAVWATAEFQGGAFDPWGGSGYDQCYELLNEKFANVFYKNNYAAQTFIQNIYMTYGGTNWGNLAEPTVYTSYDYGAAIREDRSLSTKYSEIKLQAFFLHSSEGLLTSTRSWNRTIPGPSAGSPSVFVTALNNPQGGWFYVVRQTTNSIITPTTFALPVNTTAMGSLTIPSLSNTLTGGSAHAILDGRESKILVTNYPFGSSGQHEVVYTTAEVFTWLTLDGVDTIVLYVAKGQSFETVFSLPSASFASQNISVSGTSSVSARALPHTASKIADRSLFSVFGSPNGISVISTKGVRVIVLDKTTALGSWNPRLTGTALTSSSANAASAAFAKYDKSPAAASVFVTGPYLVRNASIQGSVLNLFGDLNQTSTINVWAPSAVKSVTWNKKQVQNLKHSAESGAFSGTVQFGLDSQNIKRSIPNLKAKATKWSCADSLPEATLGAAFNDSTWIIANKTTTARPPKYQTWDGQFVLLSDEYGFHQGNVIYRGHFNSQATGVKLSVHGGFNFGYSVFLNSKFLGSSQGTNQYSAGGGIDVTNETWAFNAADLTPLGGDNVLTLVFDSTGLEEDFTEEGLKTPRGIRSYELLGGGDFHTWRIQGNLGGENGPDFVRSPLNEGGLFVERQGAHLPGFPTDTKGWTSSTADATCNPLQGITTAGIRAYRTTFNLNIPDGSDVPVALNITRTPSSSYRSVIYINGWQFGRFNSRDGPQTLFPLPEGILNHKGSNELLLTIWSLDAQGAKMADLDLVVTTVIDSSKGSFGVVPAPGFKELRG